MCITAQCPDPTDIGIWWRDDASWKLYSKDCMLAIMQALLKGHTSLQLDVLTSSAHPCGASYLLDLSKMEQTNTASGHKRAIKLILPSSSYIHPTDSTFKKKKPHDAPLVRFRLHGSDCLLVIRLGNIVKWKMDGEADAVVNPCSTRGWSQLIVAKGRRPSHHMKDSGASMPEKGNSFKSASDHIKDSGASMLEKGTSFQSVQNCAKIVPVSDLQVEQANGSVAAALHRAAGPQLQQALQKSVHFADGKGRPGDAVITPGFDLPAAHIVHTFAPPVYRKHDEVSSVAKLEKAYKSALSLAALNGIQYIAFPAMSCGAGGFPLELAAQVALRATCSNSNEMLEIHFVLMDQNAMLEWIVQASKSFSRA